MQRIHPEQGFELRWTRNEKLAVVNHNDKVCKFCPGRCPAAQPKGN